MNDHPGTHGPEGSADALASVLAPPAAAEPTRRQDGFLTKFRYILRSDRFGQIAVVYLVLMVAVVVVGPMLLGDAASTAHLRWRFSRPLDTEHGWLYVLGGDELGRSFLARLVVASRTTLLVSAAAVVVAATVGSLIGTVVGYVGGRLDTIVMRTADVMMAFPSLLLAMILLYTVGPSIPALIFVLAVTRMPLYARVARAETLAVRERLYVEAARALGAGPVRIVIRQILPVTRSSLASLATLEFALTILAESALSFLGLGVQDPDFTWGRMVANGQDYLQNAWWVAILPGVAITATAICANVLADTVRRTQESE